MALQENEFYRKLEKRYKKNTRPGEDMFGRRPASPAEIKAHIDSQKNLDSPEPDPEPISEDHGWENR